MKAFFEQFFLVLLLALFVSAPAHAQNTFRVVVFGDSLTSGHLIQSNESYPSKLYYKLVEIGYTNVEVLNMSVTGQTTSMAVQSIDDVIAKRPDIVIVELGGNDAIRGVNTDLIYKNLIDIVGKLQQKGIYVILMGIQAPESMGTAYVRQLQAVYERVVSFYRIPYYANALEGIYGNGDLTLADGYHPNGKGVDVMIENTYLYVDGGLRWKWERLTDQGAFQPEVKEALPPAMPPTAEPQELPPTVRH